MPNPRIAVLSFPGNNCEVESIRSIHRSGMEPVFCKWNDDLESLGQIDGYFLPGGFSYEDRGRAGMVAARDPILDHIRKEAALGKPVIGNCNGAQILVESGLIPLSEHLDMSLARNVSDNEAVGFISEWVWITPTVDADRCCTADWSGAMAMPIAHGEGRFTTKDPDLLQTLKDNGQLAFMYCDAEGNVSEDPMFTPNGSSMAIAGICNPEGNIVALMPHPERTLLGDPYFVSMRRWIERGIQTLETKVSATTVHADMSIATRKPLDTEVYIDTLITNNEERTVEKAARNVAPDISLTQLRYLAPADGDFISILNTISLFNPNKEVAYIRRNGKIMKWDSDAKKEIEADSHPLTDTTLLRRDEPDTGSLAMSPGSQSGVCYVCSGVQDSQLQSRELYEIFANPHASTLEVIEE